jgi:hypothetical protein
VESGYISKVFHSVANAVGLSGLYSQFSSGDTQRQIKSARVSNMINRLKATTGNGLRGSLVANVKIKDLTRIPC